MEWLANVPATVVITVCVVLLVWYFVGAQWNRRQSRRFVRGLAKGFAGLNPPPKIQWLGTSAFQILASSPPEPFKWLGIMVVLEPREMLLLWIFNRARGRRDLLVVKGEFEKEPRREVELFDLTTPTGREGSRSATAERWLVAEAAGGADLRWAYPAGQPDPRPRWAGIVEGLPFRLHRMSIRSSSPHLLLSLSPTSEEFPGDRLLTGLQAIAAEAVR
ncbi:MAG: hypothetical protein HY726_07740 [Candidatus Rokubacteria bacterium]|nr:hypothetical protein [Candidatus Rokubacteria bacterium]